LLLVAGARSLEFFLQLGALVHGQHLVDLRAGVRVKRFHLVALLVRRQRVVRADGFALGFGIGEDGRELTLLIVAQVQAVDGLLHGIVHAGPLRFRGGRGLRRLLGGEGRKYGRRKERADTQACNATEQFVFVDIHFLYPQFFLRRVLIGQWVFLCLRKSNTICSGRFRRSARRRNEKCITRLYYAALCWYWRLSRCGWRIVISAFAGHVTLSHSVAGSARLELVVADFKDVRAGKHFRQGQARACSAGSFETPASDTN
jgi:hypothetical protein